MDGYRSSCHGASRTRSYGSGQTEPPHFNHGLAASYMSGGSLTLNSANAKLFPKHILGPSENVNICRYPWISFALPKLSISSHRSGSNSLELGPQNSSARFRYGIGDVMTVPLRTKRLVISSPAAVVIGVLNGMMSSSAAYEYLFGRWVSRSQEGG